MSRELYPFYERELAFLRQMTREFATRYPSTAGRLLLEANASSDPHVERLLEGFALIGARIQHRLDDEFPELTDGILHQLYPHFIAPVPSVAILQLDHDHARATQGGVFRLQRGTMLRTQPVAGMSCRFQTCFNVDLLPLKITEAQCLVPPFAQSIQAPRGTAAVIRFRIEAAGALRLSAIPADSLRFFINSDSQLAPMLYQALLNDAKAIAVVPAGSGKSPPSFLPGPIPLQPAGLDPDEALFPFPSTAPQGLRLLTEFFACPSKFQFFRLTRLKELFAGADRSADVLVYLNRTATLLEQGVDASTFRLGCTPVVNLFAKTAEPVAVERTKSEYLVVPDVAHPEGMEVWSVESVEGTESKGGAGEVYHPFYSFRRGVGEPDRKALWHIARKNSPKVDDSGTDVHLRLVDLDFRAAVSDDKILVVKTLCTNRQLPEQLRKLGERIRFDLEASAPVSRISVLRPPSLPLRRALRRDAYWRLVSHLNLNLSSMTDPQSGADVLREIISLYDPTRQASGAEGSLANRMVCEGIEGLSTRTVTVRLGGPFAGSPVRGTEVTLILDPEKFNGIGTFAFATVLERFLSQYCSINSFTSLVLRELRGDAPVCAWPPRCGEVPLL